MYSFDASSIIYAWDNYPPTNSHFDSLWGWIAEQINNEQFCISKKALDEVKQKIPKCGEWLIREEIKVYPLTPSSLLMAQRIKGILSIEEDNYGKGVGENDLFIIAIAKEMDATLISEEGKQNKLPKLKNYKIPAVCDLPEVAVHCISFVELLRPHHQRPQTAVLRACGKGRKGVTAVTPLGTRIYLTAKVIIPAPTLVRVNSFRRESMISQTVDSCLHKDRGMTDGSCWFYLILITYLLNKTWTRLDKFHQHFILHEYH